jgi:hypothetical protein
MTLRAYLASQGSHPQLVRTASWVAMPQESHATHCPVARLPSFGVILVIFWTFWGINLKRPYNLGCFLKRGLKYEYLDGFWVFARKRSFWG